MRGSSLFIAVTSIIAILVLFIYGLSALPPLNPEAKKTGGATAASAPQEIEFPAVEFGNPTRGPADAAVTIVVFGDYLCAACAELDGWLGQVSREFPDDVRLVWKDIPMTAASTSAAQAARCASSSGAFWEYHDLLFADPQSLGTERYVEIAAQLGLDLQAFGACLDSQATLPLVERDIKEGMALDIDATPYVFVNRERSSGIESYDALKTLVAAEIEKAPKKIPTFD